MIKSVLLALIFFPTTNSIFSQKIIRGNVLEQQTKKPIPYANIGILSANVGTISNEDGSFSINIPESFSNDSILFSAIGYSARKIPVSFLKHNQSLTIQLSEKTTLLETVTVTSKKEKRKTYWLGNKYYRGGHIYADSIAAGAAMALLIENKYPGYHADLIFPVFIDKAMLRIAANTFEKFKVRIRLLELDTITKLPGEDFFNENFIVTSSIKKGWLNFDLSSFKLSVQRPFFLVFEWIMDDKDRSALIDQYYQYKKLNPDKVSTDTMSVGGEEVLYTSWHNFFAGTSFGVAPIKFSLDNYKSYYRNNSFGDWKRASAILTARILVSNQARP